MSDQKSYMISNVTTSVAGTGTISATTTALSGSGTQFLTELFEGAVIHAAGAVLAVASVTNNTSATLQSAPATPISGASFTIYILENLSSANLKLTHPKSNFKQWQEKIDLANGSARGVGRPSVTWTWGFITQTQYDKLRSYITAAAGNVYIRTRTTESADSYKTYQAIGLWPDEIDRQTTRRINFSIAFRDLVLL